MDAREAAAQGLLTRVFDDRAALDEGVLAIARTIAQKSPLAIRGSKQALNYARDHSVADGLEQIATWNAAMLLSEDLMAIMLKGRKDAAGAPAHAADPGADRAADRAAEPSTALPSTALAFAPLPEAPRGPWKLSGEARFKGQDWQAIEAATRRHARLAAPNARADRCWPRRP